MPIYHAGVQLNSAQKRRGKNHPRQNFLKVYFIISPPPNISILHQLSYYIFYNKSKRKMQLEKITDMFRVVKGSKHRLLPSSIADTSNFGYSPKHKQLIHRSVPSHIISTWFSPT